MHSIVIRKGIVRMNGAKMYILFICLLTASTALAQTITLSLKEVPIEQAFKKIEAQSTFSFIYSTETISNTKPVTVQMINVPVREALSKIFYGQPLIYTLDDRQVIVKKVEEKQSTIDLRGKVFDEAGNALKGANVMVKGKGIITTTGDNGEFLLNNLKGEEVLVISMIGYRQLEIPVSHKNVMEVTMQIAVNVLDETIVKGYYNTTRRLNTGSVDKVSGEDIRHQPVTNVLAAIEGRVPGLLITQKNGLPGSNFSTIIRGQNSIQSGNSPLYVIDGVPFFNETDLITQRSGINASSPLNTIDPSDIESVEVLKDADATAIYGSRGANGVILITTRKGKDNSTSLDVNMYQGWSRVAHVVRYMNTEQYLQMRREAFRNDNVTPTVSNAYDFLAWDSTRYTNMSKLLIGNTATSTNMNVRLSGGAGGTRFTVASGYSRQTTVFPGSTSDVRKSFSFNLNHAFPGKKFSIAFTSSYTREKSSLFNLDLTQYINLPPTIPALHDSAGNLTWNKNGFSFYNPLAITMQHYIVTTGRLTSNLELNYALTPKLHFKTGFGYNELNSDENTSFPIASQDPNFAPTGSAFFGNSRFENWIIEPQGDFRSRIGKKGKLQALVGASWQENSVKRIAITGSGYTNDKLLGSVAAAASVETKNSDGAYRYNGVFARANYSYDEKYLLNFTARRDGSSRFGPGKQFANFGAVGAAWIFTGEKSIAANLPFISFGKLRGSYGITGNDLIGDYQYLDAYTFTFYPYQNDPSIIPQKLFNADYSWEEIRKLDLALDLGFFANRINFSIDYFRNRSENQIINYSLPGQTGFSAVLQNFPGKVQNEGVEIQLGGQVVEGKKFGWHSLFQFTKAKNELVAFPGLASSSYANQYTIGKPLNSRIGYRYIGIDPQTGIYQFLDKLNNKTSTPSIADYTYLGTTDPKFYGSWNNEWNAGNWSLSLLLEFRKQLGIDPFFGHTEIAGSNLNEPINFLNRWQKPGDVTTFQRYAQGFGAVATAAQNMVKSSAYFTDASFIRVKSIYLSYSLQQTVMKKMKMAAARFFIEGQNLATITNYKGNDPESQSVLNLPPLRTLAAGIQLSF